MPDPAPQPPLRPPNSSKDDSKVPRILSGVFGIALILLGIAIALAIPALLADFSYLTMNYIYVFSLPFLVLGGLIALGMFIRRRPRR